MLNFKNIFHSKNLSYFISLFFFLLFVVIILKYFNSAVENFAIEKEKDSVIEKDSVVKPHSNSFTKSMLNPVKI